jgi:hypothetical protein
VVLRLFGGVSFYFRCPSAKHRSLQRSYVDIDFMGLAKQSKEIKRLFEELGYRPRDVFNAMQGGRRLIFNDMANNRRVDVFLDVFEMCHKFDFRERLMVDELTIPLADMLATKLQIIEINEKDLKDIISLMVDYDVGKSDAGMINGAYLGGLCGDDWGINRTFSLNLEKVLAALAERDLDDVQKELVRTRVEHLRKMIDESPKSLRWKMRARVGDRVKWYELPEVDKEVVDSSMASSGSAHRDAPASGKEDEGR